MKKHLPRFCLTDRFCAGRDPLRRVRVGDADGTEAVPPGGAGPSRAVKQNLVTTTPTPPVPLLEEELARVQAGEDARPRRVEARAALGLGEVVEKRLQLEAIQVGEREARRGVEEAQALAAGRGGEVIEVDAALAVSATLNAG